MNSVPSTLALFEDLGYAPPLPGRHVDAVSGTSSGNVKLPVHRWYRYSPGFSAEWVRSVLTSDPAVRRVLDPFAGTGTALIEAEKLGREAVGTESHPLVSRIAAAKLAWRTDAADFSALAARLIADARTRLNRASLPESSLLQKCFTASARAELAAIRCALDALGTRADGAWLLCWLAFIAVIREASHVGTAQWQYVLPTRRKAKVVGPIDGVAAKCGAILEDLHAMRPYRHTPAARVEAIDARTGVAVPAGWADMVITSPPYANNYDYADATRLELAVLGEVASWGDLQRTIRPYLVRACTQHVASQISTLQDVLSSPALRPIIGELTDVVSALDEIKESRGGKKPYHMMISCYLFDMAQVLVKLRSQVREGGRMCFVIGDSAPYGVHVPVDRWLGMLAIGAGFRSFAFEKIRDRNTKWKNRKHRVPLHEGRLWIEG